MRDMLSVNFNRVLYIFKMDLRKMLRGKTFYIMLVISVLLPVMMLSQMPGTDPVSFIGGAGADTSFGGGAMGSTLFGVLTGILLCIYIGSDYSTGFIKNIVTFHGNKFDYIIAKSMVALLCNAAFYVVYIIALAIAGAATGFPLHIPSIIGFILYIVELLISSVAMSTLVIMLNLLFRRLFGWTICLTFFLASGTFVMGIRMALESKGLDFAAQFLNLTIAGSASLASLAPNILTLLIIIVISAVWTFVYSMLANKLMNTRDIL